MQKDMSELYAQRLNRYVTAMRNGMPDRVPMRPFAAEIHRAATPATPARKSRTTTARPSKPCIRCCADFDWDAVVPNMVYVWTGLTQAVGLRYYGIPGIDVPADVGLPVPRAVRRAHAFMRREEYDELIEDPMRFLYETWLPRVSTEIGAEGAAASYRDNLSLVKSAMAMLDLLHRLRPAGGAHADANAAPYRPSPAC